MDIVTQVTTSTLKNGTTDATVVIDTGNEVKNKQEMEAEILKAFFDMPINLKIIVSPYVHV